MKVYIIAKIGLLSMNCRDSISPISFPPSRAVVIRRFMSDVSRLIAAADTFESTAFDGAEEDFILPDGFVKNFLPL